MTTNIDFNSGNTEILIEQDVDINPNRNIVKFINFCYKVKEFLLGLCLLTIMASYIFVIYYLIDKYA